MLERLTRPRDPNCATAGAALTPEERGPEVRAKGGGPDAAGGADSAAAPLSGGKTRSRRETGDRVAQQILDQGPGRRQDAVGEIREGDRRDAERDGDRSRYPRLGRDLGRGPESPGSVGPRQPSTARPPRPANPFRSRRPSPPSMSAAPVSSAAGSAFARALGGGGGGGCTSSNASADCSSWLTSRQRKWRRVPCVSRNSLKRKPASRVPHPDRGFHPPGTSTKTVSPRAEGLRSRRDIC